MSDADPRCPECGGPIGETANYCMHCSADLGDERTAGDVDGDGAWDDSGTTEGATSGDAGAARETDEGDPNPDATWGPDQSTAPGSRGDPDGPMGVPTSGEDEGEPFLAPEGLVDDTLTVVVGIGGGLVVGFVGTVALAVTTESGWGILVGVAAWLGSTAYLVRQRTVQGAVAKSGYAVAAVLLLLPLVAFSPAMEVDGGLRGRVTFFVVAFIGVLFPAGLAAGLGYVAGQFVPEEADETGETPG